MGNPKAIAKSIVCFMRAPKDGIPNDWIEKVGEKIAKEIYDALNNKENEKLKAERLAKVLDEHEDMGELKGELIRLNVLKLNI